jgi:hypothetical protein
VVRSTSIENIVLLLQKSSIKEITIRVVQQPRPACGILYYLKIF